MSDVSDALLVQLVERALVPVLPCASSVVEVTREHLGEVGWYGSHRLRVTMGDGSRHELFLKDFGSPRGPKEDLEGRRERERWVYRRLLDPARDGTARYFGSEWDREAGRFWLLLQWVDGEPLRHKEMEAWHQAARWLARFHTTFPANRVDDGASVPLRRHDLDFFVRTMERAADAVTGWSAEAGRAFHARLVPYRERIPLLASDRRCLVHGAFLPMQILVVPCGHEDRICPLDWELAALGSPAYDLGFLAYGFGTGDKKALVGAYAHEAQRAGMAVPTDLETRVTLAEAHRTLDALSRCLGRAYSDRAIREYLSIFDRLCSQLVATDGDAAHAVRDEGGGRL